jgi:hypothetical protein
MTHAAAYWFMQFRRKRVRPRAIVKRHLPMMLMLGALPVRCLAQEPVSQPAAAVYAPLSLFVGLGFFPGPSPGPTVAGAAGVRYYLGLDATSHRLFGDLSVSLMHLSQNMPHPLPPPDRDYGLGVCLGYSYLGPSGFTLIAGGGVGAWEFGPDFELVPVVQIAVGWTWHR